MARPEHLEHLKDGANAWNKWRSDSPGPLDLSAADLRGADLSNYRLMFVDFSHANLEGATLNDTNFAFSDLSGANLREARMVRSMLGRAVANAANFERANLSSAVLRRASLQRTNLRGANLIEANLGGAYLNGADLTASCLVGASVVEADLSGATLDDAEIYGISAWDVKTVNTSQRNLIVNLRVTGEEPLLAVDNLKVAQFLYLLLNNAEIRDVIDTLTARVVLILGRFTPARKPILDLFRVTLRQLGYVPVLFDFTKPATRSYRETIGILARLARFIIADVTNAKVVLQELEAIIPALTSVPVQVVIDAEAVVTTVVPEDYGSFPWFLPMIHYYAATDSIDEVVGSAASSAEEWLRGRSRSHGAG